MPALTLEVLPGPFAVCRLDPDAILPESVLQSAFFSLTRTPEETSLVIAEGDVPSLGLNARIEADWRMLKVAGTLDFALTGILSALTVPLADAGISIFALSTFDTDYLMVRAERLADAVITLRAAGHTVTEIAAEKNPS
jgi:uncharacterized protein